MALRCGTSAKSPAHRQRHSCPTLALGSGPQASARPFANIVRQWTHISLPCALPGVSLHWGTRTGRRSWGSTTGHSTVFVCAECLPFFTVNRTLLIGILLAPKFSLQLHVGIHELLVAWAARDNIGSPNHQRTLFANPTHPAPAPNAHPTPPLKALARDHSQKVADQVPVGVVFASWKQCWLQSAMGCVNALPSA